MFGMLARVWASTLLRSPRSMDSPSGIIPTAVYERSQVCAVLGIGDTKLRELVADGRLKRMTFSGRWRFFGEELIRLCRESSGLLLWEGTR